MASPNENGSPEPDHWHRYECLPPPFRRAVRNANRNFKVGWIETLIARFGPKKALELVQRRFAEEVKRSAIEAYGPDHPQAGRR